MTFTLSEEQRLLKDAARDFFQDQAPVSRLRKLRDEKKNGRDPDLWREMAAMGWAGIIVPEAFGGSGLGYVGMGLVLEQAGRTLTASPLHSSALTCASALLLAGTQAQKERWLPKIATGEAIGALAVDEGAHHAPDKSTLKVSGGKISGAKSYVAEGHIADLFIVVGGDGLYLVRSDAKGMRRRELLTVDSRGAADLTFDDADAERMEGGAVAIDAVLDRARIGLAAEMLGQAQEAFEITSEYLKTRKQFGQVIGGFQALQHRAAKLFTELELTRSCVFAALDALDRDDARIPEYASLAKGRASETLHLASNEMVQLHGGIGMTDAHDAGFYLKRARVAEALYGGASFHRDRYARLLGF
ncbi:MAG: acyl-CoA dehydrogenase family protein [Hyphomonadaceae bacterium]|nr:acyl-CoA dehydrogenase family protein [Hyphomonadaceae bacterium]MBX3509925.1 acyl-CoA dehydrogenase family protein [Hyphomonadaceae bacterium]